MYNIFLVLKWSCHVIYILIKFSLDCTSIQRVKYGAFSRESYGAFMWSCDVYKKVMDPLLVKHEVIFRFWRKIIIIM